MDNENIKISVFGLGHMGLPTAALFAKSGISVIGVARNKDKIEMINNGKSPVVETGLDKLVHEAVEMGNLMATDDGNWAAKNSQVMIVIVPTPIDEFMKADLSAVKSVCNTISEGLKKDDLVIIESTVPPRACDEIIKPLLEKNGLIAGKDFGLAYTPERAIPNSTIYEMSYNARVIGGINDKSTSFAVSLYKKFTKGKIIKVKDMVTAETIKLMENIYRDTNIALANELALICESIGVDAINAINAANYHPRVNIHTPGPGVGGHCLSIDPYFLVEMADECGVDAALIKTARNINNKMPDHVTKLVIEGLIKLDKNIEGSKIGILGISYKGDVADVRETPAKYLMDNLKALGASLYVHDPYVSKEVILSFNAKKVTLEEALSCDCLILLSDHEQYKIITPEMVKSELFVCTRPILNPEYFLNKGVLFIGVGRDNKNTALFNSDNQIEIV